MIYEIINPSDPYTFEAENDRDAIVVVAVLGGGMYGAARQDGEKVNGGLYFGHESGDAEAAFVADIGKPLGEYLTERATALRAAFDSVLIGSFADRDGWVDSVSKMSPEDAAKYTIERHDRKRSSMNDIGKAAKQCTTAMAEQYGAQ